MITYTTGNLLEADVEAVVNTVNTVGVMGKGIALMFKDTYPDNFQRYEQASRDGEVRVGTMFVSENPEMFGPKWIINFPTKEHWRTKTRIEWVEEGLVDLKRVIREKGIRSIAIPPLGCGNGGLRWSNVRPIIAEALADLSDVAVVIYEPTAEYQNVSKRVGVEQLTPARALMAEMVRRYTIAALDCTILEVQKLGWFLDQAARKLGYEDPFKFKFHPNKFGPYSQNLTMLLEKLDGSYLHCDKRLADATAFDQISFEFSREDHLRTYLGSGEGKTFTPVLDWATDACEGFESPLGMELLATVHWLSVEQQVPLNMTSVRDALASWPGGADAGRRKIAMFNDRILSLGIDRVRDLVVQARPLDHPNQHPTTQSPSSP